MDRPIRDVNYYLIAFFMILLYCTNTLWGNGGIEHVTIVKANALAAIDGNEVLIAVTDNRFPPIIPLDPRIQIVDLNLEYFINDHLRSRFSNLFCLWKQHRLHKKKMTSVISRFKPDVIISTDSFGKYFLPSLRINRGQVFIREYHMYSKFHRSSSNGILETTLGWISEIISSIMDRKYDRVVVLTHEDKDRNWPTRDNVIVLPNPISHSYSFVSALEEKRVAAAGRLCPQKNFGSLIDSWKLVNQTHPDWILEIWGDGPDRSLLKQRIDDLHLDNTVLLKGYDSSFVLSLASSSIFVLSSRYEGLPLVMIEAMSCGVPVVSSACPCGPKDLINDGENGFLVPVNDKDALADRLCRLMDDQDLRKHMGAMALEKSKHYRLEQIINQWMSLFEHLLSEKQEKASLRC